MKLKVKKKFAKEIPLKAVVISALRMHPLFKEAMQQIILN